MNPQRILITGAGSGIGAALVHFYTQQHAKVLAVDCDDAALQHLGKQTGCAIAQLDLLNLDEIERLVAEQARPFDQVIHSAGISAIGPFQQTPVRDQLAVLRLNLWAPMALTRELLASSLVKERGGIAFISSLSTYVSYPGAAGYAASKDGLAHYARTLSVALAAKKIHVCRVHPGPTRTPHAQRYSPENSNENRRMPPERVAREIYQAMKSRRRVVVPGFGNKVVASLGMVLPRVTEWLMRQAIFNKLRSEAST